MGSFQALCRADSSWYSERQFTPYDRDKWAATRVFCLRYDITTWIRLLEISDLHFLVRTTNLLAIAFGSVTCLLLIVYKDWAIGHLCRVGRKDMCCLHCSDSFLWTTQNGGCQSSQRLCFWLWALLQVKQRGRSSRPEGVVPVRLVVSGFGQGCRRSGGLGVRCRLSPLAFPLFWSSILHDNSHLSMRVSTPLPHQFIHTHRLYIHTRSLIHLTTCCCDTVSIWAQAP